MADFAIDLEWWRDTKGYQLLDAEPPKRKKLPPNASLLAQAAAAVGKPQRIVRLGGEVRAYRPLSDFGGVLFPEFARVGRDPLGLLNFIRRFGTLTRDGLEGPGEDVPLLIRHAEAMHGWLAACRNENRAVLPEMIGPEGIKLGSTDTVLSVDPITLLPKLRHTANSLLTAIWLQLGQALQKGVAVQQCRHCGQLFETGPGTTRRLDAKFCTDAHRIAFNSLSRSKGRNANA